MALPAADTQHEFSTEVAALTYADIGWPVFPVHSIQRGKCSCGRLCGSPGKHPRTAKGLKDATTDTSKVKAWWRRYPDSNIGIVTGAESGLVVMDIDPRHDGDDSLENLASLYEPLPDTLTAITGSGGRHFLFKHPGVKIKNSAGLIGPGIDIRGDGGYIVAAPSSHAQGSYSWANWGALIKPMPAWMLDLLTQPKGGEIRKGTRNVTLTSIAGSLKTKGLTREKILGRLDVENQRRCTPPLEPQEITKIVDSVSSYQTSVRSYKTCWQEAVISDVSTPQFQRFVLIGLSLWMDAEGGNCYPSNDVIAQKLGLSRQGVANALSAANGRWIRRYRRAKTKQDEGQMKWSYGYAAIGL